LPRVPAGVEDAGMRARRFLAVVVAVALDPQTGRWAPATARQQALARIGLEPVTLDTLAAALAG
jgi:hypothetical protein